VRGDIVTPPTLERYELKFAIPPEFIGPISDFVSVYCSPDAFSASAENGFYSVYSMYFDTPYLLFLKNRLRGCDRRFNMRVRWYDESLRPPFFLEVKQKAGSVVRKYRGIIDEASWDMSLDTDDYMPGAISSRKELRNVRLFQRLRQSYGAEPKILTGYRRKAFVSDCDVYARVTFDVDLRYLPGEPEATPAGIRRMVNYDMSNIFGGGCSVVLELKCYTTQVPLWMIDCIRTFGLQRRSFSKYASGMIEGLGFNFSDYASRHSPVMRHRV
jgi:hypothetical protein